MDITDFEGIFKYKFFIPILYAISWIAMFLGPSLFPVVYQQICFGLLAYLGIRVVSLGFINFVVLIGNFRVLKRAQQNQNTQYQPLSESAEEIYHAFIIPSYKQDIELISETMKVLAKHKRAKSHYLIFLAMEMHEEGSDKKAQQIINKHKSQFRLMDYTRHIVKQYQQKGKASNVSWCAQHLQPIFNKNMIPQQNVLLTIIDVDSWAPDVYFDEVQDHLRANYAQKDIFIYQPPQVFTRNHLDVPVMSRVYDYMHSSMHCANLFSFWKITFPLSNYSMTYTLAKRMGYWDTVEQAIGEDFHTTQKAIWKTHGQVKAIPIYAPFNQLNISTGEGYCADLEARFWQAQRHARGIGDCPYTIHMFLKEPFTLKTFVMSLIVMELFILPALVPWVFLSLTYQTKILYVYTKASPELISQEMFGYIYNLLTLGSLISFVCFQIVKRRSTSILYKLQNEGIWRVLQYAIFYVPNLFIISIPAFVIAAFGSLKSNREYVVADKVATRKEKQLN